MAFCGTKKFRCDSDMSLFISNMADKLESRKVKLYG